jgi:ADP-dependent phosphofructokinase/glucokinase
MRKSGNHIIHLEFADFSSFNFFKLFEKYVVREANSLGMNEIEIRMLLRYWENPHKNPFFGDDNSAPTLNELLGFIPKFFSKQKELGLDISRLHMHPYGSFFMCYDTNKWHDARDAIVKSSLAVPRYCMRGNSDIPLSEADLHNFQIGDLPEWIELPYPGQPPRVQINKETLTYKFRVNPEIECYM